MSVRDPTASGQRIRRDDRRCNWPNRRRRPAARGRLRSWGECFTRGGSRNAQRAVAASSKPNPTIATIPTAGIDLAAACGGIRSVHATAPPRAPTRRPGDREGSSEAVKPDAGDEVLRDSERTPSSNAFSASASFCECGRSRPSCFRARGPVRRASTWCPHTSVRASRARLHRH